MFLIISIIIHILFISLCIIIIYLLNTDYGYLISISKQQLKYREYTRNIIFKKKFLKIEKFSKATKDIISSKSLYHSPPATLIIKTEPTNTIFNSVICWCLKYPGNAGEILRSAYNAGFNNIIFITKTPLTNTFWKTIESRSMGTFALIQKYNILESEYIMDSNYINICIETGDTSEFLFSKSFKNIFNKQINLFVGSEYSGIPGNILNKSNYIFNLGDKSYNVCAAFSISIGSILTKNNI